MGLGGGHYCGGFLEVGDGAAVVSGPGREDLDGVDEGPAEVGEAVLDVAGCFGVAFDQAVLLESAQCLSEDLAGDTADEVDELAVPARLLAEAEEHEHGPLVGDDFDRQARGAVGEDTRSGRGLHGYRRYQEVTEGSVTSSASSGLSAE